MADKLGLGSDVRQLKLGQTFSNPRSNAFHTVRYDFKPASVDINKMATVDVGNNNQVTVTVPHLDGAGVPQTLFKGNQKPYQKECVLIIDRVTGEITLEKLSSNVQVKKTRSESYKPSGQAHTTNRPLTPVEHPPIAQRTSSKTKVTSGSRRNATTIGLIPKHSPLHASPSHHPSPSHGVARPPVDRTEPVCQSTLASLPMIGLDDVADPATKSPAAQPPPPPPQHPPHPQVEDDHNGGEILTDSSSSSSSGSCSSDSDSEPEPRNNGTQRSGPSSAAAAASAANGKGLSLPEHLLNEDLCLSESATDSD